MAELRYLSEGKMEMVVVFLPDVWTLVPTEKEWTQLQQEQQVQTTQMLKSIKEKYIKDIYHLVLLFSCNSG